ncbi:MAG: beta-N-acetylhexosaminidase [Actinomycetota bacterium]|nr:beta-N-acetylhexosaminidase [Actinomycetota bacterium]
MPAPSSLRSLPGAPVALAGPLVVSAPAALGRESRWLRRVLEAGTGWRVDVVAPSTPADVVLETDPSLRRAAGAAVEGAYRLVVADGVVRVTGDGGAGVFYGLQTLRQLLPDETLRRAPVLAAAQGSSAGRVRRRTGALRIEPVAVVDAPQFAWRGVHLDVSRHFMPKSFLFDLVDLAAFHKLNVLHLHLTDDQGWRVEIERYPRLVEVGAWRRRSPLGHARERRFDREPHGGYYTKDDLREVVAFAAERHVVVVPEIDMPGHVVAAIAAYPELGHSGRPIEVGTRWGVYRHVLNLEPSTIRFFHDVVHEVCEIFPGPYFHIGGDECPTVEWRRSERARAIMAAEGFDDPRRLQGWFSAQIAPAIASHGKRLVGWDEILEAGAPEDAVVMSWRGLEGGVTAASRGHDVVMVPEEWLYFDWSYADDPAEPLAIRGPTPVEKVYGFDPVPAGIPDDRRDRVLGAQCQLWTEYVKTPERAEYQYFPRLCAFAEAVWSQPTLTGARSYPMFEPRLSRHLRRLAALGVNYRPLEGPTPGQSRTWRRPPARGAPPR